MDHRRLYGNVARDAYLAVTPEFDRMLYMLARSCKARTIIEFGTSFCICTIHLAEAVRDSGGGRVITTEFEPSKAERARKNLEVAGLEDLVEIRVDETTLKNAKVAHLPIYHLRHVSCTRLSWVAADAVVQRAMRHSSPETKRHYQLGMVEQVRQNLEKANERVYDCYAAR
jgi:tRNA A58 N-methylase Trm61